MPKLRAQYPGKRRRLPELRVGSAGTASAGVSKLRQPDA